MKGEKERAPEIQYPCEWVYTIIGKDPESMKEAADRAITPGSYKADESRVSRSGKYTSMKIRCTVRNEQERKGYFNALQSSSSIRFIL